MSRNADEHENRRMEYREWQCDVFAFAAHRLFGLPMGVWCNDAQHACVLLGDAWIDAYGLHYEKPAGNNWTLHRARTGKALQKLLGHKIHKDLVQDAEEFILMDPELCRLLRLQ
jgi:hypothetical protein